MTEVNLKRCDAICLKISVAALILMSFICAVGRFALTTEIIGYCLTGILVLLAVIRTALFYIMDKREIQVLNYRIAYKKKQDTPYDMSCLVSLAADNLTNFHNFFQKNY